MADIVTNTLQIGNDNLILRDADAQEKITGLKEDLYNTIVTDTASGSIASFPDGADNVPVKSLKVNIEPVQSGSGDPSPDNVRPISGFDSVKVTRTGKNFLPNVIENRVTSNGITVDFLGDGEFHIYGTTTNNSSYAYFTLERPCVISVEYFHANNDATYGTNKCAVSLRNGSVLIQDVWLNSIDTTFKLTSSNIGGQITRIMFVTPQNETVDYTCKLMLSANANDSYEPYQGEKVTIPLTQTVYGGTLDVTQGVLTVDRAIVDLGTLTWDYNSSDKRFYSSVNGFKRYTVAQVANAFCSQYYSVSRNDLLLFDKCFSINTNVTTFINIRDTAYSDATVFKTAMSGVQLAYEIAEPLTVQLTANDIKTLMGTNNIWSDAGDIDVEYRADTKLYIEKLTAPTEDDMVADHAISANSFFMIGNTLYRATTAIASGATITVGTNATKLSLSDALNALS